MATVANFDEPLIGICSLAVASALDQSEMDLVVFDEDQAPNLHNSHISVYERQRLMIGEKRPSLSTKMYVPGLGLGSGLGGGGRGPPGADPGADPVPEEPPGVEPSGDSALACGLKVSERKLPTTTCNATPCCSHAAEVVPKKYALE